MPLKKKICVVTSSRADYWLLKELITLLHHSEDVDLLLFVAGGHLLPSQGHSIDLIKIDGFPITAEIHTNISSETNTGMAKVIGQSVISFADSYSMYSPDIVVLLGDRFETLATAIAAYSLRIPIAHIHGGEVTFGALDDNFRHGVTKFSSLHFVSHNDYAKRVRQLGENPENIFVVGATCIDQIAKLDILPKDQLNETLGLQNTNKYALCCYHPVTQGTENEVDVAKNILEALLKETELNIIITKANIDPKGVMLNQLYEEYRNLYPNRIKLFDTLGGKLYFNTIAQCEFFIGNSSSGIIEVPYFKKATINVGDRQQGRITSSSTHNCSTNYYNISEAIKLVQNHSWKQENVLNSKPVYGDLGKVAKKIYEVLITKDFKELIYKKFWDL